MISAARFRPRAENSSVPGRNRRRPAHRRAAVALEFIIGLIVLTGMTLAVIEYGILMLCRHTVAQAATLAAREAAKKNSAVAANTAALTTVNQVLSIHGLVVVDGSATSDVVVIVEYGGTPATVIETGDPALKLLANAPVLAIDSTDVRVTVFADMTAGPMINALAFLGADFNYAGKIFKVTALVQKE